MSAMPMIVEQAESEEGFDFGARVSDLHRLHHVDAVVHGGGNEVGTDNIVLICRWDHPLYEPHGPYRLAGDPEQPDGLRLVRRDEAPRDGPSP